MDTGNSSRTGSSKMEFIDLNETPVPSPREMADEATMGSAGTVCPMCRKGIPVGRVPGRAAEEPRQESKCFRCLLKADGAGSSGSGRGGDELGRFDINALPPCDSEDGDGVQIVAVRDGNGGGKVQASFPSFSSHSVAVRQLNPALEGIGRYLPKTSSFRTDSTFRFTDMLQQKLHSDDLHPVRKESTFDSRTQASQSTQLGFAPESPNMLYLQSLREYIAERSGVLGDGWHVQFEFCDKRYRTSSVYIAPDGSRLKSMEDVARHIGLPSRHHIETGKGSSEFALIQSGLKLDPSKKESSTSMPTQNSRQRQRVLRANRNQGFLSSAGLISCPDVTYNRSSEEVGFSDNGRHHNGTHDGFPVQFQDFCLISAGKVDPRTSYHNKNVIWPVGYRSSWHDRITGSLFICDVADGGDFGPVFKVQRYPCTKQSVPVGSIILAKTKPVSCRGDDEVGKGDLAAFQVGDDDSISTITLLNEDSPPSLENCLSTSKREDSIRNSQEDNSSNSDLECLPNRTGNLSVDAVGLNDVIGEFQIEGQSTSYAWEMVTQTLLYGFQEIYKQKGAVKFFCAHDAHGMNDENLENADSLSRYGSFCGHVNFPPLVQNENEFKVAYGMLLAWLNQDRFGLDTDFVQEIIEQLPGVAACSEYRNLNSRKNNSVLQTVGSGFLQADKKPNNASGTSRRSQLKLGVSEDLLNRGPCPLGKPLSSKLPSYLTGDALQVWEFAWRFSDVLGLGQSFSFQELEAELVSPWIDSYPWKSRHDTGAVFSSGEKVSQVGAANPGRCSGILSAKIIGSLLKVLVCELTSKAAAYVCPNFDTGESKSRRGKKKDLDSLAALKKTKLGMLTVNELTWHEIARRYILAVLSMEGNLDSTEIANRESGKVFHCLHGDGGILCGSLSGIAALEGDAVVLADAMKEVYGSLKGKNEIVSLCETESDGNGAQTIEVNDSAIPEWAQVLEPVRKLPTNVGARIRRCINEALERNPPEWAKKILEHSISKEVYKGNASGPTKRAVISVLAKVSSDNPQPKAEKKEKVKVKTSVADLISKQCRIVLRQAVALDEDKVFCNLLARIILNPNDNDEDGLLGYPAMVSRPLDFRTIDLRLAAGAYGGSHEAFVDDVREVWRNINTAYGDRSDLVAVANDLSNKFEELFEKEVLTLVHKISEVSNGNDSNAEAVKERDDLLLLVCNSSLPRAPWDEGICKVCGMDKDDDNVLLCDKCDSEYHRYCLNPPLLRIPEGNWYCPSCVGGQSVVSSAIYGSVANQFRNRRYQRPFTSKFLEGLARLANLMEVKECWEFTVEERIFFMKFLFDEALNSTTIRDHMDQCATRVADLQQKLRALTSELRLLKVKEEMLGLSTEKANSGVQTGRGDLKSDASSSLLAIESSSRGKQSEIVRNLPPHSGVTQLEHGPPRSNKSLGSTDALSQAECQQLPGDHNQCGSVVGHVQQSRGSELQNELPLTVKHQKSDKIQTAPILSASQAMPDCELSGPTCEPVTEHMSPAPVNSMYESHGQLVHTNPDQADVLPSKDNSSKVGTVKNDIINLQSTIASLELELYKVSLRKDFLGRDSSGRVYWVFYSAGAQPWIITSGDSASRNRSPEEFINVPGSDKWMYYECDDEIGKLVGWLREDYVREKELRESILQLQINKLKDSQYTQRHLLSKDNADQSKNIPSTHFFNTKALPALGKKFGPSLGEEGGDVCQRLPSGVGQDGRMYRCECLELLWPDKGHCLSCHQSFSGNEELRHHSKENCRPVASAPKRSLTTEDISKRKKPRIAVSQEKHPGNMSRSEKQNDGSNFAKCNNADCPFNFEEIMTRFAVQGSVKDDVNEIGLIGSGGIPSFLPTRSPYLSDPALALGLSRINEANSSGMPTDLRSQWQYPNNETGAVVGTEGIKGSNRLLRYAEGGLAEGSAVERLNSGLMSESNLVSSVKDKGAFHGLSKSNIIRESSSRPLVGKAAEILRFLKINLLDMDAALPEDALRTSRLHHDKRRGWREFVKSAKSIYEMVQATVVFEDTIRSEYLRNDWWYWSSPSTAAKITTLSALALRIYTLDSVICYEKLVATEASEPTCALEEEAPSGKNSIDPSSPSLQNTPEPDPSDTPRTTRSRAGKRKKD